MSLQVQQPSIPPHQLSSLLSPSNDQSTDAGNDLSTDDSSSAGGGKGGLDVKSILQTIEQILQSLQAQDSGGAGDQGVGGQGKTGGNNAAGGQGGQGQDGLDPNSDIAGLLRQIAQEFEARMANQNKGGDDSQDDGVPGVGGASNKAAAPAGGGQPAPAAGAQPAAAGAPPAPATGAPDGTPPPNNGPTPPDSPAGDNKGANGLPPGISLNAGGVPQADAIEGVSPHAVPDQVKDTGTGTDKTFNVTNCTSQPESFTYSVGGDNKATISLKPGETGAFRASSDDVSARITPDKNGVHGNPNEVLFEDGSGGNPDISKVDGDKDAAGKKMNMTVTMSDGAKAGDGDPIHAYAYSTDDAASMGLAGNKSKTANIVMSDVK